MERRKHAQTRKNVPHIRKQQGVALPLQADPLSGRLLPKLPEILGLAEIGWYWPPVPPIREVENKAEMRVISVTIKGITPLLMHRFAVTGAEDASKLRTGVPDWEKAAELAKYADEKGHLYQPAEHIERTLAEAAKNFKITGRRGATYSKLVGSTVDVEPFAVPHKIQKSVVDSRPVVVQKARVIRYRPRLDDWELDFNIRLHDDQLQTEVIKQILDYAGLYVGIGDYRPQKKGKFGKFMVIRFDELKKEAE